MFIERLHLNNYRNLLGVDINFHPSLNLFVGRNAQGKTNILESIFLLGTGSSHRTNNEKELINWDSDFFYVKANIHKRNRDIVISYGYNGAKKEIKIDNNLLERRSELLGYINIVLFSPEDLQMVKGSPAFRRRFLNLEISQVNPYYYHNLQKYNQVLKQRNLLLKEIRQHRKKNDLLFVWDQQLVDLGSRVIKKRFEVVEKLDILARLTHRKITDSQENLSVEYSSSIGKITKQMNRNELKEIFISRLRDESENEIMRGMTLIGPHRDDLVLKVNDINIRQYGSQGQQRTTALALKIAELEFMKSEMGEYPILLLDDVFSELDSSRQSHLLAVIKDKIQTFITSTDANAIGDVRNNCRIFQIDEGKVESCWGSE